MIQYVIATHGKLADGFMSALELFVGNKHKIDTICAYLDDEPLEIKWETHKKTFESEDEVVVFTDLYGGSVNQFFTGIILQGCSLHVITGVNLGLMAELIIRLQSPVTEQDIQNAIADARDGMSYMNQKISELG